MAVSTMSDALVVAEIAALHPQQSYADAAGYVGGEPVEPVGERGGPVFRQEQLHIENLE